MKGYKTVKTTTGHRYHVRITESESAERFLYWFTLVTVPFFSAALMFFLWVKAV
jgi:hypothetical protein